MSSSAALRKHLSKYLHPSQRSIFNQVNLEKLLTQEVAQHSPFPSAHKGPRSLAVDIKEFNNQIELVAEVPGLSKDQVQLEIHAVESTNQRKRVKRLRRIISSITVLNGHLENLKELSNFQITLSLNTSRLK